MFREKNINPKLLALAIKYSKINKIARQQPQLTHIYLKIKRDYYKH